MSENRDWYTYRQAAQRVGRSTVTIKKWRRKGLTMSWDTQGRRIVEHHTLLAWWRDTLKRDYRNRSKSHDTPIKLEDLL